MLQDEMARVELVRIVFDRHPDNDDKAVELMERMLALFDGAQHGSRPRTVDVRRGQEATAGTEIKRPMTQREVKAQRLTQLPQLLDDGMSSAEIAEKWGVSNWTIIQYRKEIGRPGKRGGGPKKRKPAMPVSQEISAGDTVIQTTTLQPVEAVDFEDEPIDDDDPRKQPGLRKCVGCGITFASEWAGNRQCRSCRTRSTKLDTGPEHGVST